MGLNAIKVQPMNVKSGAYQEHRVFADLGRYAEFYEQLSMSVLSFISMGTKAVINIDTYVYSSVQGTLESIRAILQSGRINDAYALIRKYHDSTTINIYADLYLKDHFSIDNFVVEKIENWLQGKEKLPKYGLLSKYIEDSEKLKPINDLVMVDDRYKKIRERCNDHMHYNFFRLVMLNDNEVHIENRVQWLDVFANDVLDLFVRHLAYMFFLNDHYMTSSDYLDALECGMQPEEDSQYWVAPFIQATFDEIIKPRRPDIVTAIKANTAMQLT